MDALEQIAKGTAQAIASTSKQWSQRLEEQGYEFQKQIDDLKRQHERDIIDAKKEVVSQVATHAYQNWSAKLIGDYRVNVSYDVQDLVTHNGGVFQRFAKGEGGPGEERSGWVCLVDGVSNISWETSEDGRYKKRIEYLSSGKVLETEFHDPLPIHKGKWEEGQEYEKGDEVAWSGSTWRSKGEGNGEEPGKGEGWLLVAQRGARGPKGEMGVRGDKGERGERGERGLQGESADPADAAALVLRAIAEDGDGFEDIPLALSDLAQEVKDAFLPRGEFDEFVKGLGDVSDLGDERVQLFARGDYQEGQSYRRGDVVNIHGVGLFVALRDTVADPRLAGGENWLVLFAAGQTAGGGITSAVSRFTELVDTPPDFSGSAGLVVAVNSTATALEFVPMASAVPVATASPNLTPVTGELWYSTGYNQLFVFNGTSWVGI